MENTAVIYQSKYGFTKTYALWIAEETGADLLDAKQVTAVDLQKYSVIVYGGGLYAGGVNGISLLTKNFQEIRNKRLFLFTVGAADVTDPINIEHIQSSLKRVLTPSMLSSIKIYHLRGGMKYSQMTFLHRSMMGMMIKMVRKKPKEELRPEDEVMLETYGQDVDFTDRQAIAPLLAALNA